MRAVDTNVLVRLVTRDDRKQVAAAELSGSKGSWVSTLVLAEATWVDRSRETGPRPIDHSLPALPNWPSTIACHDDKLGRAPGGMRRMHQAHKRQRGAGEIRSETVDNCR
jgi:hypothetical protein